MPDYPHASPPPIPGGGRVNQPAPASVAPVTRSERLVAILAALVIAAGVVIGVMR
ncbi:hypothetical protein [Micromonospora sp. NPDC048063]|uniref:hypothetical protein n=1 Tax=Micromonospora sp. NPDC048063 TaxID=3364256 RepID=UPI003714522C